MGIELDVLVGHPEHDLLFVATQVARAAGIKNPSELTSRLASKETFTGAIKLADLGWSTEWTETLGSSLQAKSWIFTETAVYTMLMRGHAPQSEPFRKWVTEQVLPTIRKTGKYDAAESQNPIAQGVMDELKALRGEVVELKEIIREMALSSGPELSSRFNRKASQRDLCQFAKLLPFRWGCS